MKKIPVRMILAGISFLKELFEFEDVFGAGIVFPRRKAIEKFGEVIWESVTKFCEDSKKLVYRLHNLTAVRT